MKKKKLSCFGFSVMELVVSFIVVALITGVSAPIMFKKSSKMKLKSLSSIAKTCDAINPTCAAFLEPGTLENRCQIFKKRVENGQVEYSCALCKTKFVDACKAQNTYFETKTCKCLPCSKFDTMLSPACTNCCTRCSKDYCTGCALGYGLPKAKRNNVMGCTECPVGKYSDTNKDEECKNCDTGFYQPDTKKTSKNDCKPCEPGHYCDTPGLGNQKNCNKGTYQNEYQKTSCKDCLLGNKCPSEGMSNPTPCEIGKYQDQTKQISCKDCSGVLLNSTTASVGSDSADKCICTNRDYILKYSPINKCGKCSSGTYRVLVLGTTNVYQCMDCPTGFSCQDPLKDPVPCGCGTYAPAKSSSCKGCDAGTYSKAESASCSSCASGVSRPNKCGCCPEGSVSCDNNGNSLSCIKGYYLDSTVKRCKKCSEKFGSKCVECTSNKCTKCTGGYGMSNASSTTSNACYCKTISDKQKESCDPLNAYYIKTDDVIGNGCKGMCVKKQNVGDETGSNKIPFPISSIRVLSPDDNPGCPSDTTPCCWKGNTTVACTQVTSYSPCNRTVCNYNAAYNLCNQNGWRLPSADELHYLFLNMSSTLSTCYDFYEGRYDHCQERPLACWGSDGATPDGNGGYIRNFCHPHGLWGQNQSALAARYNSADSNVWFSRAGFAFSTRCVKEIDGDGK